MKKRLIYMAVVVSMLLSLVAVAAPGSSPAVQAIGGVIWHVDDNGDQYNLLDRLPTIQEAIDNASSGDTIWVYQGTYNESIFINKSLTILGVNGSAVTFIDGGDNETAVDIVANGVTIGDIGQGFTITNAADAICYRHPGMTGNLTDTRIAGNTIHGCEYGIDLDQESNADMRGNTITGNTIYDCEYAGIYIDNCNTNGNNNDGNTYGNTISGNRIYNCGWYADDSYNAGIVFDNDNTNGNIHDNTIENNNISDCYFGISFENSYNGERMTGGIYSNTVHNNSITDCSGIDSTAIFFENQQNGAIRDNTISGNTINGSGYDTQYGIWLYAPSTDGLFVNNFSDNTITGNTIYGINYFGIYLEAQDCGNIAGTTLENNTIYDSYYGIVLENGDKANIFDTTISDNKIYACDEGIELYNAFHASGDIYENTIDGNKIHDCSDYGINLYSGGAPCIRDNTISNNTVYNCTSGGTGLGLGLPLGREYSAGTGIALQSFEGNVSTNTVEGNYVYNCSTGIYLNAVDGGYMSGNDILNNTVEYYEDGIGISVYTDSGHIGNSTIEGNHVYGDTSDGTAIYLQNSSLETLENIDIVNNTLLNASTGKSNYYGIRLFGCNDSTIRGNNISNELATGLYIAEASHNISVTGNTVHNNSEGIHIANDVICGDINIFGNDIRNNTGRDTGIAIDDYSYNIDIYCNNIAGNSGGISCASEQNISANNNWWGNPSGPSGEFYDGSGDSIDINGICTTWLTQALTFNGSSPILDTAAVPGTISALGEITDEFDNPYSAGPSSTDLIVQVNCNDPCGAERATVNLSALLLDLLPANFQQEYASNWNTIWVDSWNNGNGAYLSDIWQEWMTYLANTPMNSTTCEDGQDLCLFERHFDPMTDFVFKYTEDEATTAENLSMYYFFNESYYTYSTYDFGFLQDMNRLLTQELRLGDLQVPVTVYSCYNQTTATIPLTIVDFQIALDEGWNLRSTPVLLDANYSTWGEIRTIGDGIPGFQAALTYNTASGKWEELTNASMFTPLQAYFIDVNETDTLGFIVNSGISAPPTRQLLHGWNLVGPAPDYMYYNGSMPPSFPFSVMSVWDALISAQKAADNTSGWTNASGVSQDAYFSKEFYYKDCYYAGENEYGFFQDSYNVSVNGNVSDNSDIMAYPYVSPWGGYWVYVQNPATLTGFSYTPMPIFDTLPILFWSWDINS